MLTVESYSVADAPPGTGRLLAAMFLLYVIGLGVLIASKI